MTSSCPLEQSRILLARFSTRIRILSWAPLPLLAGSVAALQYFDARWYANVVVVAIFALFLLCVLVASSQFRSLRRTSRETILSLKTLERLEDHPDPKAFREAVCGLPASHVRNLVISWIDLGANGNEARGIQILDNARERRDLLDGKLLGIHVALNRNILKIGFIGTLVGLLLTFPPMRAAVMGLSSSGGEMKFISDIATSIDEDAYAIQATLVSMGFSFFLEVMVVQLLERLLLSFQMVDSLLGDWYILRLHPWIAARSGRKETESVKNDAAEEAARAQLEFVATEHRRLALSMRDAQRELSRRGEDLAEFESRYRAWLPPETAR